MSRRICRSNSLNSVSIVSPSTSGMAGVYQKLRRSHPYQAHPAGRGAGVAVDQHVGGPVSAKSGRSARPDITLGFSAGRSEAQVFTVTVHTVLEPASRYHHSAKIRHSIKSTVHGTPALGTPAQFSL